MPPATRLTIINFPPFELDLRSGQLRDRAAPVALRPKTFAVLRFLAERPGELVTKRALLDAVWGDVAVSEDVVRLSVGELRAVLGDDRAAPRFIETVPRRGYRFVAKMGADHPAGTEPTGAETAIEPATAGGVLVGRERERAEIAEWFGAAASGTRRIGFVTGEAGIGKTTIVDAVLRDLRRAAGADLRIGRGQCVEQFGGGEPYLPVLEAITMLARGPDRPTVETSLRDHAPEWLLGLMGLLEDGKGEPTASTPEHTLHRLAATLEALAVEIPLVLVLEDLHWSDYSTLDLVSMLAQRRESARLLVVCTLRPAEAIVSNHPVASVKRELMRKGLSREILLAGLSPADVRRYLAVRFGAADLPENLLPLLVDRSEGNPFFLVALVDHLLERRLLTESADGWELREASETLRTAVPDSLRALIEPRLEALTEDERHVLAAGSVAGLEFAADVVARAAPQGSDLADQMVLRFVF